MKSLFYGLSALALVSVAQSNSSHADRRAPQRVVLGGHLLTLRADPALGVTALSDGRVDIDVTGRVARLAFTTRTGQQFAVQAPVTSITRDTCGSIIYTAIRTGSDSQTLVIRDNSDNHCGGDAVRVSTEVALRRQVRGAAATVSKFQAERLSRQSPNFIIDGE
jgi:hypothetical protein